MKLDYRVMLMIKFQSTLSMRRATRPVPALCDGSGAISIHALHEESDQRISARCPKRPYFNPRSP